MFKEYTQCDATELARLIQNKEVSPLEVVEAAIHRIEETNSRLNAVVHKMYESARQESQALQDLQKSEAPTQVPMGLGPLAGVPFLVKDLGLELDQVPTSGGSRLTQNYKGRGESEIITRYKKAGLITLGKTNVPEFGIMGVTEPYLWGPCRNPWDLSLTPGGSSGGSAAAVAARMVPIATADDGGGSIRIPAAACGLFGFKPSRGLQPMGPKKNESWLSLVCGHVLSRSVRDSALLLDLTKGVGFGAAYGPTKQPQSLMNSLHLPMKGKRVAFTRQSLLGIHTAPECQKALNETLKTLASLGLEIIEDQPPFNKQELLFSYYVIVASSTAGEIHRAEKLMKTKASLRNIEHATWFLKAAGEKLRANHLEQALYVARQATLHWEIFFQKYDYFCSPTLGDLPSPIGLMNLSVVEKMAIHLADYLPLPTILSTLQQIGARGIEKTPNTCIFNMSGHPAMSVPTYWTPNNLPVGIQFVGKMGEDDQLFALASCLENHYQWGQRSPYK